VVEAGEVCINSGGGYKNCGLVWSGHRFCARVLLLVSTSRFCLGRCTFCGVAVAHVPALRSLGRRRKQGFKNAENRENQRNQPVLLLENRPVLTGFH
jgi:hypothetical protein